MKQFFEIDMEENQTIQNLEKNSTITLSSSITQIGQFARPFEALLEGTALPNIFIIEDPKICQGEPIIEGTRISVTNIIELYHYLGWWDIRKIQKQYPHLTEQQIIAAIEYYKNHMDEIDSYLEEEKEID